MENPKKIKFFDWLLCFSPVTASIALPQKSGPAVIKFQYPRVPPGDQPRAEEPEEYEIAADFEGVDDIITSLAKSLGSRSSNSLPNF